MIRIRTAKLLRGGFHHDADEIFRVACADNQPSRLAEFPTDAVYDSFDIRIGHYSLLVCDSDKDIILGDTDKTYLLFSHDIKHS